MRYLFVEFESIDLIRIKIYFALIFLQLFFFSIVSCSKKEDISTDDIDQQQSSDSGSDNFSQNNTDNNKFLDNDLYNPDILLRNNLTPDNDIINNDYDNNQPIKNDNTTTENDQTIEDQHVSDGLTESILIRSNKNNILNSSSLSNFSVESDSYFKNSSDSDNNINNSKIDLNEFISLSPESDIQQKSEIEIEGKAPEITKEEINENNLSIITKYLEARWSDSNTKKIKYYFSNVFETARIDCDNLFNPKDPKYEEQKTFTNGKEVDLNEYVKELRMALRNVLKKMNSDIKDLKVNIKGIKDYIKIKHFYNSLLESYNNITNAVAIAQGSWYTDKVLTDQIIMHINAAFDLNNSRFLKESTDTQDEVNSDNFENIDDLIAEVMFHKDTLFKPSSRIKIIIYNILKDINIEGNENQDYSPRLTTIRKANNILMTNYYLFLFVVSGAIRFYNPDDLKKQAIISLFIKCKNEISEITELTDYIEYIIEDIKPKNNIIKKTIGRLSRSRLSQRFLKLPNQLQPIIE